MFTCDASNPFDPLGATASSELRSRWDAQRPDGHRNIPTPSQAATPSLVWGFLRVAFSSRCQHKSTSFKINVRSASGSWILSAADYSVSVPLLITLRIYYYCQYWYLFLDLLESSASTGTCRMLNEKANDRNWKGGERKHPWPIQTSAWSDWDITEILVTARNYLGGLQTGTFRIRSSCAYIALLLLLLSYYFVFFFLIIFVYFSLLVLTL
jgi:hypothetical protein